MSVNPFQTMRARYFLIVFALLTLVARASNELIEHTFHMQNSTFINILIFYILPMTWIFLSIENIVFHFHYLLIKMKHLTWCKFYTLRLCYACLVMDILFYTCIVLHGLHQHLL